MKEKIIDLSLYKKIYPKKSTRESRCISTVNRISIVGYNEGFGYVFSNDEVTTTFLSDPSNKTVISTLINRYYIDRIKFLKKHKNISRIIISTTLNTSSYGTIINMNGIDGYNKSLCLELSFRIYDINSPSDFEFLDKLLEEIANSSDEIPQFLELEDDSIKGLKSVLLGNFCISYDKHIEKYITKVIMKQNNRLVEKEEKEAKQKNLRRN